MRMLAELHDLVQLAAQQVPAEVPDPKGGVAPPGVIGDKIVLILKWIAYLATAAAVAGLIMTAGRMAIAYKNGDEMQSSQLAWTLAACVLIGGASSIVAALIPG
jgi:hypothetical protein